MTESKCNTLSIFIKDMEFHAHITILWFGPAINGGWKSTSKKKNMFCVEQDTQKEREREREISFEIGKYENEWDIRWKEKERTENSKFSKFENWNMWKKTLEILKERTLR